MAGRLCHLRFERLLRRMHEGVASAVGVIISFEVYGIVLRQPVNLSHHAQRSGNRMVILPGRHGVKRGIQ